MHYAGIDPAHKIIAQQINFYEIITINYAQYFIKFPQGF